MAQYINKDALVVEIERMQKILNVDDIGGRSVMAWSEGFKNFIDTLEVKEVKEPASTSYVVTRSEEHSDYVEKVFFDEDKAQEYCDQFKGNENEYARHITKVEVTL